MSDDYWYDDEAPPGEVVSLTPGTRRLLAGASVIHAAVDGAKKVSDTLEPLLDKIPFTKLAGAGLAVKVALYAAGSLGVGGVVQEVTSHPIVTYEHLVKGESLTQTIHPAVQKILDNQSVQTAGPAARQRAQVPTPPAVAPSIVQSLKDDDIPIRLDSVVPSDALYAPLVKASHHFGLKPELIMTMAWLESHYRQDTGNAHSSARGLFQFTDAEWLRTVALYDRDVGWKSDDMKGRVRIEDDGRISVSPQDRDMVMSKRLDPTFSAQAAAYNASRTLLSIAPFKSEGHVGAADIYLRHLLGERGSQRFLKALSEDPTATVDRVVSNAAIRGNRPMFTEHGHMRSLGGTYAEIDAIMKDRMTFFRIFIAKRTHELERDIAPALKAEPHHAKAQHENTHNTHHHHPRP